MTIDASLLSPFAVWMSYVLYGVVLLAAIRIAPWTAIKRAPLIHVFLGTAAVLLVLWHMRAEVQPGLFFNLSGLTVVTLMFGWALAVIVGGLALFAVAFNIGDGWQSLAINGLLATVVPVTLAYCALIIVRWYLPRHFFIYVMVNGFLTAGVVGILSALVVNAVLIAAGAYTAKELGEAVIPFYPLMYMPEAFLNGWLTVILIAFRPHWVYSFSDEQYIAGK